MPPASEIGSSLLRIDLCEGLNGFQPGDTIVGTISRQSPAVFFDATVTIRLHGRSKTKIEVSHGQSTSKYRGRFNFFDRTPIMTILHRGPIHIALGDPEGQLWPFALTLPLELSRDIVKSEGEACWLKPGAPEAVCLPPTFNHENTGFSTSSEGYVEYHLEATVMDIKEGAQHAVLPIKVVPPMVASISSPTSGRTQFINDFRLKENSGVTQSIASWHLDPAMANTKLSFSQKARKMFGSSKVPTLGLQMHVSTPHLLQIGNPAPVPFQVRASVVDRLTSTSLQGAKPLIIITRFRLQLISKTEVIAPGTFDPHTDDAEMTTTLAKYDRRKPATVATSASLCPPSYESIGHNEDNEEERGKENGAHKDRSESTRVTLGDQGALKEPIEPPDADTLIVPFAASSLPLDLGQALVIYVGQSSRRNLISPTLKTFNIQHTHILVWKLEVDVAGEKALFSSRNIVNIV